MEGSLIDAFHWEFSYIITCFKRYKFIKHVQIMYIKEKVEMKNKPL